MTISIPDDTVNAFVPHSFTKPIKGAPSGPLAGLSFAIKDLYSVTGHRNSNGSPDWYEAASPATTTAPTVQKLLDAGATAVGLAVCDEFFFSLTGDNVHYPIPHNTRAPGRMPGGSSSGSAAAVAAGLCDFALGSDTGGSVRVPASFCGIYGLRPTHGRVDLTNASPMAADFDTAGWFADDADIFRRVGPILLDGAGVDCKIGRLLIAEDAFGHAEAPVAKALRAVVATASSVLPEPQSVSVAPDGYDDLRECFRVLQGFQFWQTHGAWIEAHQPNLGPGIRQRIAMSKEITKAEHDQATARRVEISARIHHLVPEGTIVCQPTAPSIAPRLNTPYEGLSAFRASALALNCTAGLSGLPQVTLPAARVDGCPIGLSFIGWAGGDQALLDLSVALAPYTKG